MRRYLRYSFLSFIHLPCIFIILRHHFICSINQPIPNNSTLLRAMPNHYFICILIRVVCTKLIDKMSVIDLTTNLWQMIFYSFNIHFQYFHIVSFNEGNDILSNTIDIYLEAIKHMGFHQLVELEIDPSQPEFTDYHHLLKLFLLVQLFQTGEDVEVVLCYPFLHLRAVLLEIYDLIYYLQNLYQFLWISTKYYHNVNHLYNFLLVILMAQFLKQFSDFNDWLCLKSIASALKFFNIASDYQTWSLFLLFIGFYHTQTIIQLFSKILQSLLCLQKSRLKVIQILYLSFFYFCIIH